MRSCSVSEALTLDNGDSRSDPWQWARLQDGLSGCMDESSTLEAPLLQNMDAHDCVQGAKTAVPCAHRHATSSGLLSRSSTSSLVSQSHKHELVRIKLLWREQRGHVLSRRRDNGLYGAKSLLRRARWRRRPVRRAAQEGAGAGEAWATCQARARGSARLTRHRRASSLLPLAPPDRHIAAALADPLGPKFSLECALARPLQRFVAIDTRGAPPHVPGVCRTTAAGQAQARKQRCTR